MLDGVGDSAPPTIEIAQDVIERFPYVSVSAVLVTNLSAMMSGLDDGRIDATWSDARASLAEQHVKLETLAEHDVLKPWRVATKCSGLKPSTYKSSVEALCRRLLREGPVQTPVRAVNLYCALSTKHLAPAGGYDLDRLETTQITLRLASPATDKFLPLSGKIEDMPLTKDVVVYAAGSSVICWSFNHRDARDSALTPLTSRAVFLSEALTCDGRTRSIAMLRDLAAMLSPSGVDVSVVHTLCSAQRRANLI
ncbi:MAG: hypothetical protein IBJ03_10990 [Gemmatimonadaceae bacterium]|nr:hypothetical protein [Gemmatimonadaceae bacterium]